VPNKTFTPEQIVGMLAAARSADEPGKVRASAHIDPEARTALRGPKTNFRVRDIRKLARLWSTLRGFARSICYLTLPTIVATA
jgi:hypothetical protein